ncbi:Squalene synthase 2 [Linum perenne]
MGAGMAKFILKEVETVDDYDEYCHYVAGLVGLVLSKLFHASGKEDLASDSLSNSMGLFLQDLKYEENSGKAVQCLNDMVTNALIHMDDCVKYLSNLKDPSIFRFCAIPQPASPPINSLRLFPPPIHPLSGGFLFAFSSNPSSLRPPPSSIPPAASNSSIHLPPAASYPPIHLPPATSFSSSLVAEEQ